MARAASELRKAGSTVRPKNSPGRMRSGITCRKRALRNSGQTRESNLSDRVNASISILLQAFGRLFQIAREARGWITASAQLRDELSQAALQIGGKLFLTRIGRHALDDRCAAAPRDLDPAFVGQRAVGLGD